MDASFRPINHLAALGISWNKADDNCYINIPYNHFKRLAKRWQKMEKNPENRLSYYAERLAKEMGFESANHYKDFLKARNEWGGNNQRMGTTRYRSKNEFGAVRSKPYKVTNN